MKSSTVVGVPSREQILGHAHRNPIEDPRETYPRGLWLYRPDETELVPEFFLIGAPLDTDPEGTGAGSLHVGTPLPRGIYIPMTAGYYPTFVPDPIKPFPLWMSEALKDSLSEIYANGFSVDFTTEPCPTNTMVWMSNFGSIHLNKHQIAVIVYGPISNDDVESLMPFGFKDVGGGLLWRGTLPSKNK